MKLNRMAQLVDMQEALAAVGKKASAINAEMVAYLAEMALIQVDEDLKAERPRTAS